MSILAFSCDAALSSGRDTFRAAPSTLNNQGVASAANMVYEELIKQTTLIYTIFYRHFFIGDFHHGYFH